MPSPHKDEIPLFEYPEERIAHQQECRKKRVPALFVNKEGRGRPRQTWANVEIELDTTAGRSHWNEERQVFTQDAVDAINEICDDYSDVETKSSSTQSLLTTFGAGFVSFPDMRVETAKEFGRELRPIVTEPDNLISRSKYRKESIK